MHSLRSPEVQKHYEQFQQNTADDGCTFCSLTHNIIVDTYNNFNIIKNRFPYSYWDKQTVEDHLLILPKRHLTSLADQSTEESSELMSLITNYENNGYSLYMRAPKNESRTMAHIHLHLFALTSPK